MDFTDIDGRSWEINIRLHEVMQIEKNVGINLGDLHKDGNALWTQILEDTVIKGAIIWQCCKQRAIEKDITEESFFCAFNADVLADAENCLMESIIAFSRASTRPALKTLWKKTQEVRDIGVEIANQEAKKLEDVPIEEMREDLEKAVAKMTSTSSNIVLNLEDKLESTPATSP